MAKTISIDFSKAPPQAKAGRYDRVPEGTYYVKPSLKLSKSKSGGDMMDAEINVSRGPQKGKTIRDFFTLEAQFGVQRLHGLLVACGIKQQNKVVNSDAVIKAINGKECVAEIVDNVMEATAEYPTPKTNSSPAAYYAINSKEAKASFAGGGTATADDDDADLDGDDAEEGDDEAVEEVESGDDEVEGDDDAEEEEEEEPAPKKSGKKAGKAKAKKATADDDIFDDDED